MIRVCMAVVLLFQNMSETRNIYPEDHTEGTQAFSRYLWDKLQIGTRWKVYIRPMTYDILHSSINRGRQSNYRAQKTLLNTIRDFPSIIIDRHPCRSDIFVAFGREFGNFFFDQHTNESVHVFADDFRICREYNFTYNPMYYIGNPNITLSDSLTCLGDKPLRISWNIQAGEGFGINYTLSEFTVPHSHSCSDAKIKMNLYNEYRCPLIVCPNWAKQTFVAIQITVNFFLRHYHNPLFIAKRDQKYIKLSFYYQILDLRNVAVTCYLIPYRQPVKLGMQRRLQLDWSDKYLMQVGQFPYASVYAFALYIGELYGDFLTPVIYRNNFTCNIPEAKVLFYDGPIQPFWEPALPVLKYWNCPQNFTKTTANRDNEEVRGSLDELNIIILVPRYKTLDSSHFALTWHAHHMLPEALRIREVVLDLSKSLTIHFPPTPTTFIDVVHVQAPESKSVHLSFTELNYVLSNELYARKSYFPCRDGLQINDPMDKKHHVIGQICSNVTAENIIHHYQTNGLIIGHDVVLMRKQYGWLSTISGVITARAHRCIGYVNILPDEKSFSRTYRVLHALVDFGGTFDIFNDSALMLSDLRVLFRCFSQACCKIQIVPFGDLALYQLYLYKIQHTYLKYTITSEDLTSPSRFSVDFSSIGNMVEFRNASSVYGIRVYTMNSSCRFAGLTSPYTGVWYSEAYSAQIGLHSSILMHAAGFSVTVEQGRKPPICTDERGTDVTAMFFDVNLLGPCANTELNIQEIRFLVIYKTHQHRRCCLFDGYISSNYSIQGEVGLYLKLDRNSSIKSSTLNYWPFSDRDTNVKFQVICTQACLAIMIDVDLWNRSLTTFRVGYLAKLIEQNDLTGVTFTQIQLPIGLLSPRPRLISWQQVCLHHRCYITPKPHVPMVVTWDQAKTACERERATLVSINSDLEWALLTRHPKRKGDEFIELYDIRAVKLFYIGIVSDVHVSTRRAS